MDQEKQTLPIRLFIRNQLWIVGCLVLFGCSSKVTRVDVPGAGETGVVSSKNPTYSDTLFRPTEFKKDIKSIRTYYIDAKRAELDNDSIAAEKAYEIAYSLIEKWDPERFPELQELADSVLTDYQDFYSLSEPAGEENGAEKIMEEVSDYEDSLSVNNGDFAIPEDTTFNRIPLVMNKKVESTIRFFQTRGRRVFTIWLERLAVYGPLIRQVLKDEGLPEELVYLAMIESGFNVKARSYARAVGPWQFIQATGKAYGLRSSWWFDERRDPLKSTHAAARHLRDLHNRFNNWYLAMAGYNVNPNKVERNMRRAKSKDFWDLKRLPRQTRNYIPTFIGATIIAKNPEKYGFLIEPKMTFEHDTVSVHECIDLNVVAECVDSDFETLKDLNPAVVRWCTPPDVNRFTLNLPVGTRNLFLQNYAQVPDSAKQSWTRHPVRPGETPSTIARKYKITTELLIKSNKIRNNRIIAGDYLLIPVSQNKSYYTLYREPILPDEPKRITFVPGHKKIIYLVRAGDTLGQIAEDFSTRAQTIRDWNGLRFRQHIFTGQKLAIWVPEKRSNTNMQPEKHTDGSIVYTVKSGDSLWDIASNFGVKIEDLRQWNQINGSIQPGDKLKIPK